MSRAQLNELLNMKEVRKLVPGKKRNRSLKKGVSKRSISYRRNKLAENKVYNLHNELATGSGLVLQSGSVRKITNENG